jgi:DNA polymerase
VIDAAAKGRRLEQLALSWRSCTDCALSGSRQRVVFYRGNPSASIAIVGEAPGHEEDVRGIPFVGPAGKVIDGLLREAKVSFDDVCFVNMVGCRPPGNRAPKRAELVACEPRTLDMLRTVDPAVVLMLGLTAAKLAGVTSIGPWRGMPVRVELGKQRSCRGVVTYHPSFLLRQGNSARVRRHMLSDIKVARAIARKDRSQ